MTFSIPPGQRKFPVVHDSIAVATDKMELVNTEDTISVAHQNGEQASTSDPPIIFTIEGPQNGPQALEKKILQVDGRIENPPNGNAWKVIRCKRDNQDMGSLWEMREEFYVRQPAKKTLPDPDSDYESPRQKRLKARK